MLQFFKDEREVFCESNQHFMVNNKVCPLIIISFILYIFGIQRVQPEFVS